MFRAIHLKYSKTVFIVTVAACVQIQTTFSKPISGNPLFGLTEFNYVQDEIPTYMNDGSMRNSNEGFIRHKRNDDYDYGYHGTWHGGSEHLGRHAIKGFINELLSTIPLVIKELFGVNDHHHHDEHHGHDHHEHDDHHGHSFKDTPGGFVGNIVNGLLSEIIEL